MTVYVSPVIAIVRTIRNRKSTGGESSLPASDAEIYMYNETMKRTDEELPACRLVHRRN